MILTQCLPSGEESHDSNPVIAISKEQNGVRNEDDEYCRSSDDESEWEYDKSAFDLFSIDNYLLNIVALYAYTLCEKEF